MNRWIDIFRRLFIAIVIYIAITTIIFRFNNPGLSETELFISIPRAILLDFK